MTIEEVLTELDPMIRKIAGRRAGRFIGYDDWCQELRIAVMDLYRTFDPNKSNNILKYMRLNLPLRASEIFRKISGRDGVKLRIAGMTQVSQLPEDDSHIGERVDNSRPPQDAVEWKDFLESLDDSIETQAFVRYATGELIAPIAADYGVSSSAVWTMLNNQPRMAGAKQQVAIRLGVA